MMTSKYVMTNSAFLHKKLPRTDPKADCNRSRIRDGGKRMSIVIDKETRLKLELMMETLDRSATWIICYLINKAEFAHHQQTSHQ